VSGDITRPLLGMSRDTHAAATTGTTHVWHLAAIYDLAVPQAVAYRVNVIGTSHVLDFAAACRNLKRLDYVSTCYVSGARKGLILERELDEGQAFKNHYESTKAWAEMEVRRRLDRIPTCIHRPAVVVGDSHTGETDKYDGPYYVLAQLVKLPRWVPMINIGHGHAVLNLVPVDFLVDAMAELWVNDEALGQTVHLADPYPHTAREILGAMLQNLGFHKPLVDMPPKVLEGALGLEPLRKLVKIPREVVAYNNHEAQYDTSNQRRLLERTDVRCPDILTVVPAMAEYVQRHPVKHFIDNREARR
jgi:thioester reductase-like protein